MKRTLLLLTLLCGLALPTTARAESIALGLFLGEPTGLDIKIGLQRRSAIDIVIGKSDYDNGVNYGHLTYLALLGVAHGQTVHVPIRLGIGAAFLGVGNDGVDTVFAVRAPLQVGLRFRRTPVEVYGEVSFVIYFFDNVDTGVDGGIGVRFYF